MTTKYIYDEDLMYLTISKGDDELSLMLDTREINMFEKLMGIEVERTSSIFKD